MIKIEIPQIIVSQEQGTGHHKEYMFLYPMSQNYGRLNLRNHDFAIRHHYVNQLIRDVYFDHSMAKKIWEEETYYFYDNHHYTYNIKIEMIIYWLRKNCDEVIALFYYTEFFHKNNREPDVIAIDSIGSLLAQQPDFKNTLSHHIDFLTKLNNVSNAYKHSVVNHEAGRLIGRDEPTVVAYHMKNNSVKNNIDEHSYYLKDFIHAYALFFEEAATFFSKQKFF